MKCPSCGIENLEDSKFCRKCATALPGAEASFTRTLVRGPAELAAGTVIAGHYKIARILGRGGMGIVYLAEDIRLKRPVALKFLPPGIALDEDIRRRFIIEAQAAAALSHSNICTIYEVDDQAEKTFISMEYVEGKSLREKAAEGPLPFDCVLDISLQVCAGLDEAHKKGIVHRDIKSANIMMTEKGQAKIMDFGLAKVAGTAMVTREGSTMGTVAYMSPEQARGEEVDTRTDIWSLGVVLYELASGKMPFKGDLESAIIHNIIHEEPKPLKAVAPKVPEEFERIIRRALKKKVEDRYGSAAEMLADLKELQTTIEKEKAGVFNLRSFLRIIRKPLIAVPTALVLIALCFLIYSVLNHRAKIQWAKETLLPEAEQLIGTQLSSIDNFIEAYELAQKVEKYIAGDRKLTELLSKCSVNISIKTEPPGAKIYMKKFSAPENEWRNLGVTPIEKIRFPVGNFRWRMEKEGYETVLAVSTTFTLSHAKERRFAPYDIKRVLDKKGNLPSGMVRVAGAQIEDYGNFGDFFIDQYEVTNKQFKEFVDKGGYQKNEYWSLSRSYVMALIHRYSA
jgi:serine/threonine protein kinase